MECYQKTRQGQSFYKTDSIHADDSEYKRLSGDVRTWTRKGDSGETVTNNYCINCSNLVFVEADAIPGVVIFMAGTLDDKAFLDGHPVIEEIYTKNRPSCVNAIQGAKQTTAQPG